MHVVEIKKKKKKKRYYSSVLIWGFHPFVEILPNFKSDMSGGNVHFMNFDFLGFKWNTYIYLIQEYRFNGLFLFEWNCFFYYRYKKEKWVLKKKLIYAKCNFRK